MAEARINREIESALSTEATGVPEGRVCDATLAEWDEFQTSDTQELPSSGMEWINGTIFIVELQPPEHDDFVLAFELTFLHQHRAVYRYIKPYLAGYIQGRRDGEPGLNRRRLIALDMQEHCRKTSRISNNLSVG